MHTLKQLKSGELKGITSIKLSEGLSNFPVEIFELADTLETLDLSNNLLTSLPADFGRLKKLRILFCSNNLFYTLPEVLSDCPLLDIVGFKANKIETIPSDSINPNLRWLILTDNCIKSLPASLGNCSKMEKLMLAGNCLEELPQELSKCSNLALLRISANQFTALPQFLLSMPKLAWLAFSGNPFCKKPTIEPLPSISWKHLEIIDVIGEGASGIIYKAVWNDNDKSETVAVKVFKGSVTSDGFPQDEMNASIAAGSHYGLIKLIGQIDGHPTGKKGLVMEFIPERFYNLGMPPSLATCSRDTFKTNLSLDSKQIAKIALTVASVAAQLHNRGIMHSDLYAHNILIDQYGNTLFGDFGASCFYDRDEKRTSKLIEQLEVLAYGYLLDDLLSLNTETSSIRTRLVELKDLCLTQPAEARPDFEFFTNQLSAGI